MKGQFDYALDWVQRNYPDLWLEGKHFTFHLISSKNFQCRANGLCFSPKEDICRIEVRKRICHVRDYIEVIVHELTHASQWYQWNLDSVKYPF